MKHLLVLLILAAPSVALAQVEDPGQTATPTVPSPAGGVPAVSGVTGDGPAIFKHGTMGLSFGIPTSATAETINLLYFMDGKSAVDIIGGLSLKHTADMSTTTGMPPVTVTVPGSTLFGFEIGLGYRMYQHHSAKIHTFLEPFAVIADTDASNNFGSSFTLVLGGQLGAECMFTDWFSVSGTVGVQLDFANKFDTIVFTTATAGLNANFYWE